MVFGIPVFLPEKMYVKNCDTRISCSPHSLLGEILSGDMLLMQFQQALVDLSQGVSEQYKNIEIFRNILEETKGIYRIGFNKGRSMSS